MKRTSNMELCRIIGTLMIIMLHYNHEQMGGALGNVAVGTLNYYLVHFTESLSIIGVNLFVLITGYFSLEANKIKIRKIVDLYFLMVFYGIIGYCVVILGGASQFSLTETILVVFPFLAGRRWFVETYIILLLFMPFLNKLIHALSKKEHQMLLGIYIFIFSLWESFGNSSPVLDGGYGITNFILLYFMGAYIRKHGLNVRNSVKENVACVGTEQKKLVKEVSGSSIWTLKRCGACLCLGGFIASILIIFFLSFTRFADRAWEYCFIFVIAGSVFLFLYFVKYVNGIYSHAINSISGLTYGIFLIHSDFSLWDLIYKRLLKCNDFYNSIFFLIHSIISVMILFVVCAMIDYMRKKLFKYIYCPIVDKIDFLNKEITFGNHV